MNALVSIGAVQVLIMLVAVVRAMVLAHTLGVDAFGIVGAIDQTAISVMQLGALSLPFTALKFLSASHSGGLEAFQREFSTFFRGIATLGILAATVACVLVLCWPGILGELEPYQRAFVLAFLGVPAAMLNILFMHTLAAAQRGAASAVVNLVALASLAATAIAGAALAGIGGLYTGALLGGVAAIAGTLLYLRSRLGVRYVRSGRSVITELRENREIARYALFLYTALAVYSVTMLSTRYVVIDQLGTTGAGLLQALLGISMSVGAVLLAMINLSFAPRVNRQSEPAEKVRIANEFTALMCVVLAAGAVAVALFPQVVVTTLYTREFVAAAPILFAFLLWQCGFTVAQVAFQLLIGLDDIAWYAVITAGSYLVAAALFPVLVLRFGLAGIAYALSAGSAAGIVAVAIRVRARTGQRFGHGVWIRFAAAVAAILGAALLFRADATLDAKGVAARGAFAFGVAVVLGLTLTSAERAAFASFVAGLRSRGER